MKILHIACLLALWALLINPASCYQSVGQEGEACNNANVCEPGLVCSRHLCVKIAAAYCPADGRPCVDDCYGRVCGPSPRLGADCGECPGDSNGQCYEKQTCTVEGACVPTPSASGKACDDQVSCSIGKCDGVGNCVGTRNNCNGHGICGGEDACSCNLRYVGNACQTCAEGFLYYPYCMLTVNISTGGNHTCAFKSDGVLKCWGHGDEGQLGEGNTNYSVMQPVNVKEIGAGMTQISAGGNHTCALSSEGVVKCWGDNASGQLGIGTTEGKLTPVEITGLGGASQIVTGGNHTCALLNGGSVKCWGKNDKGQLGVQGLTSDKSLSPIEVDGLSGSTAQISANNDHTCALLADGLVKCWGIGQLLPELVTGIPLDVKQIAAGGTYACALFSGGGVKCWGKNDFGQLGNGETNSYDTLPPVDVTGLASGVVKIAAGAHHTCALLANGGVKCWGANLWGELGNNTTNPGLSPVDVIGISTGAAQLTANGYSSCAYMLNGFIKCWGNNEYGQLGDGSSKNRRIPVNVPWP